MKLKIRPVLDNVEIEQPNEEQQERIDSILAICERIFKGCDIKDNQKSLSEMLINNILHFVKLHDVPLMAILINLENNLIMTELSMIKNKLSGERFLSYLGGMIQGVCLVKREITL